MIVKRHGDMGPASEASSFICYKGCGCVCAGSADRNDSSEKMTEVAVLFLVSTGMAWPNYTKYEPFNNSLVTKKNYSLI